MSKRPSVHLRPKSSDLQTHDSFQNFLTKTGIGAGNVFGAGHYGFNPITRNYTQLEWAYRGSWVVGKIIDAISEDMTREGVTVSGDPDPSDAAKLEKKGRTLELWKKLEETIKWARLYGGAGALMMIDGQDPGTPLNPNSIGKDQLKGLLPLDRWMLNPVSGELVDQPGPDFGKPKFYATVADTVNGIPSMNIHHSRFLRFEGGIDLPYRQRMAENGWSISVMERVWDRLMAYDSSTSGAAQMVHKAHLRTYKVNGLRQIISMGGDAEAGLIKQMAMIRAFQSNEGLTLMDAEDEFETHQYAFAGVSDILLSFGEQLAGASDTPLVRLLGQSPGGLGSNGEGELRNYHEGIKQKQESQARTPVERLYDVHWRSTLGGKPPEDYSLEFNPLWQLNDEQKGKVTSDRTAAVNTAYESQIIRRATALRELKALAPITGAFSNITDDEITQAENDPVPTPEALGLALPKPTNPGPGQATKKPGDVSTG